MMSKIAVCVHSSNALELKTSFGGLSGRVNGLNGSVHLLCRQCWAHWASAADSLEQRLHLFPLQHACGCGGQAGLRRNPQGFLDFIGPALASVGH